MVIPVPFGAAEVSWAFNFRGDTGTILDFVSLVASSTFSVFSPSGAVVTHWGADSSLVEDPSLRAGEAFLVIPVPFGTAEVSWTLDGRQNAGSVLDFVSLVAGSAFSVISPGGAVVADRGANSSLVESPSV